MLKLVNSLTPYSVVVDAQIGENVMVSQRNLTFSGSTECIACTFYVQ